MNNSSVRITLIEDDEDDQLIFSIALDSVSIPTQLTILKNGKELQNNIKDLESLSPDIIFLGCPLLLKNEIEYLRKIKGSSLLKKTFCVVHSGHDHSTFVKETFNAGANLYIAKCNDFPVLINMINKVLNLNWKECPTPKYESFLLSGLN